MSLPTKQPLLAVDAIIVITGTDRLVLIERKNPPYGWALPGGMVDYGESLETAVAREAKEETGLTLDRLGQFRAYSEPSRDPRGHVVSVVFVATAHGEPKAADDAKNVGLFSWDDIMQDRVPLAFDHKQILLDVFNAPSPVIS